MPSNTPRLGLIKSSEGEGYNVNLVNSNSDEIDKNIGFTICTSTTRPAGPWRGQQILETDTLSTLYHDGTRWVYMNTPIKAGTPMGGAAGSISWTRSGDVIFAQARLSFAAAMGPLAAWATWTIGTGMPKPRYTTSAGLLDTGQLFMTNSFENSPFGIVVGEDFSLRFLSRWASRSMPANSWFYANFSYFTDN